MQTEVLSKIAQIIESHIGLEVRIVPLPTIQSSQRYRVYLTMGILNPLRAQQYEEIKFNIEAGSEKQILREIMRKYERINAEQDARYDDEGFAAAR